MAGATGLEPAASGVTGRRSNQLSYAPVVSVRGVYCPHPYGVKAIRLLALAPQIRHEFIRNPPTPKPVFRTGHKRFINDLSHSIDDLVGGDGIEPPTPSV